MTVYVLREGKKYSRGELCHILDLSVSDTEDLIRHMLDNRIINYFEYELDSYNNSVKYVIDYVGLIFFKSLTIYCCPKISDPNTVLMDMPIVLKAIMKHHHQKRHTIECVSVDSYNLSDNVLHLYIQLILDYIEKGIYSKPDIIWSSEESNGEVDWNMTVEHSFPFIQKNNVSYLEIIRFSESLDSNSVLARIHTYLLYNCINFLNSIELLSFLSLSCNVTPTNLSDSFEKEYMVDVIEKGIATEYVDSRLETLNLLKKVILLEFENTDFHDFISFGTNSFYNIWESACKFIVDDEKNKKIKYTPLFEKYPHYGDRTLLSLLDAPMWRSANGDKLETKYVNKQIPDIVRIYRDETHCLFFVMDAKYYVIKNENGVLDNVPGLHDVVKQHVYLMDYSLKLKEWINQAYNIFLLPGIEDKIMYIGTCELPILSYYNEVSVVHLIELPWKRILTSYVSENRLSINVLRDCVDLLNQ